MIYGLEIIIPHHVLQETCFISNKLLLPGFCRAELVDHLHGYQNKGAPNIKAHIFFPHSYLPKSLRSMYHSSVLLCLQNYHSCNLTRCGRVAGVWILLQGVVLERCDKHKRGAAGNKRVGLLKLAHELEICCSFHYCVLLASQMY